MRRFFEAPEAQLAALGRRANQCCVRFSDCELPPGAVPQRARVGFEVSDAGAVLFVDLGVRFEGGSPRLQQWFRDGRLRFDGFAELAEWIRTDLSDAYRPPSPSPSPSRPGPEVTTPLAATEPAVEADANGCPPGRPFAGRESLVAEVEGVLLREWEPAVAVLVGPAGCGKSAIVREIERRWRHANGSAVRCRAGSLAACHPSEKVARLQHAIDELLRRRGPHLLVVENLDDVLRQPVTDRAWLPGDEWQFDDAASDDASDDGGGGARPTSGRLDRACHAVLVSALEQGMRVCGIAGDPLHSSDRRLQVIRVDEPSTDELLSTILPTVAADVEYRLGAKIDGEAHAAIVSRARRFESGLAMPGAAVSLLERLAIEAAAHGLGRLDRDGLDRIGAAYESDADGRRADDDYGETRGL